MAADLGHSPEFNHKFWKEFRRVVKEANPEAIILAEHYGDAMSWLQGDEWDTVMNYDAFMEPVTWFLTGMEKHSDEKNESMRGNANSFFGTMRYNMAKFIYSMQNVLNIKERMETQAKTEYAQMLGALHDEEVKMHNIMSTLNSYKVQASQLSIGKLDIAKIRRCNEAIKITEDMAKNQAVMVKLAERNVEASMKRLADAVKERKVQEKLKEKAFEQFLQELNAQEMKEIDEVVSFNYNDREEDE